ncbi:rcc01693 family protein [Oceaniglobus indicus]|uniref:rcc01693 family protein n=1 Tax=Oceaniglobus indicus TaxID=2047749 RepID=UPI000C19387A|nr:rcc01693 family protein [Oceaniglobus indicus]
MAGFDWPGLMRAGIRGRGLSPDAFWALTPAELMMMLGRDGPAPMGRAGLDALAARFPDADPMSNGVDEHGHGRDR